MIESGLGAIEFGKIDVEWGLGGIESEQAAVESGTADVVGDGLGLRGGLERSSLGGGGSESGEAGIERGTRSARVPRADSGVLAVVRSPR